MANRGVNFQKCSKMRIIIKLAKSSKITGLQNDQEIARVQNERYKEREAYETCKLPVYVHIRPIQTTHFIRREHIRPIRVLNCGIIRA